MRVLTNQPENLSVLPVTSAPQVTGGVAVMTKLGWLALAILLPVAGSAQGAESGLSRLPCTTALARIRNAVVDLADGGRAQLRDGKACQKARPTDSTCEWQIELTRAERWGHDGRFLLAVVHANHDGPGAWDSVLLYACERGTYVSAFSERFLYGANVEIRPPSDVSITAGVWAPGDPTCCPSSHRRRHYTWDTTKRKFILVR